MSPKPKAAAKKIAVAVPKNTVDEITLSRAGLDPVTYPVANGTVEVDQVDLEHFLAHVEGSTTSGGNPAPNQE